MYRIRHSLAVYLIILAANLMTSSILADEDVTLIGTIVKWRYPEAEIRQSEMSDAATVDGHGTRTDPSTFLKTTMVTPDSVDKVMTYYRNILTRNVKNDQRLGIESEIGRSVFICDESSDRPFTFHTILINESDKSTTILITRAPGEDNTHITWKQYLKHSVGK